uniref:Uncharacterized protein n=1 Tax=Panagrolaimus sp. ES5 TaxID=591445 RepID=A0AC34FDT0_9BILA
MASVAVDFSLVTLRRKDGRNKKRDRKSIEEKHQSILMKTMDITVAREKKRLQDELMATKKCLELEKKKNTVLKVKYSELYSIYKRKCGGYYYKGTTGKSSAKRRSTNKSAGKSERRKSKADTMPINSDRTYDEIQMLQAEIDGLKESTADMKDKSFVMEETIRDVVAEKENKVQALKAEKEINAKMQAKIVELEATIKTINVELKELQSNIEDLTKENAIILEKEQKAQTIIAEHDAKMKQMKAENAKQKVTEKKLQAKAKIVAEKFSVLHQQYQQAKSANNSLNMLIKHNNENLAFFRNKEREYIARIKTSENSINQLQKAIKIHKKTISKLNIKEEPDYPKGYIPTTSGGIDEHQNFSFFKFLQNVKDKVDTSFFHKTITLEEVLILIVESICPLVHEDSWEAYSKFDCSGKPVKISLKKDSTKFMLQLNGRLNVSDAEIEVNSLLHHVDSCHLTDLRLVDQTISKNDFMELVASKTIKNFAFYRNTVTNGQGKGFMKMEEILKELPNAEKVEYWLRNNETPPKFDDFPAFPKLRSFSLYNISESFDFNHLSEFIKKHSNVNFTFKFCPLILKRVKENIFSMKSQLLQSMPSTVQVNISFA